MPGVDHHALVYVAQRQVTQHFRLRMRGHDGQDRLEIGDNVGVGELHALHGAGGAGGVDHGGHVVGRDALLDVLQILRTRVGDAQLDHLVEMAVAAQVSECIYIVLQLRNFREDVLDLAQDVPAGDEHHLHIRVMQDELVVALADGGINGHMDGAELHDGHVEEVPFGTPGTDRRDLVALLDAQLHQSVTDVVDDGYILLDAVVPPNAILLPVERVLTGKLHGIMGQEVEESGDFHGLDLLDDKFFCGDNLAVDFKGVEVDAGDEVGDVEGGAAGGTGEVGGTHLVADQTGDDEAALVAGLPVGQVVLNGHLRGGRVRIGVEGLGVDNVVVDAFRQSDVIDHDRGGFASLVGEAIYDGGGAVLVGRVVNEVKR